MPEKRVFDIIIAGGGASGLHLALALIQKKYTGSVLIADKTLDAVDDKTWCFWSRELLYDRKMYKKIWNSFQVTKNSNTFEGSAKRYFYQCLSSKEFKEYAFEKIAKTENFTLIEGEISEMKSTDTGAELLINSEKYQAKKIYQSLYPAQDFYEHSRYKLKQHFLGWEIKTKTPLFQPEHLTLMNFDVPKHNGVSFMYALPFDEKTALLEYTLFSSSLLDTHVYEEELASYLKLTYDLERHDYDILRQEFGVIPMVEQVIPNQLSKHIYCIGTAGGAAKPSTGYMFKRSYRQALRLAKRIVDKENYQPPAIQPNRYRYYDLLILHLMATDPDQAEAILFQLFKKNGFDSIFQFLSEDHNFWGELKIMASCPWLPFFKAMANVTWR